MTPDAEIGSLIDEQPESAGAADNGVIALFARLVDDADRFVRAELQLYRAELFARLKQGRAAIVMMAVALLLAQAALVALLVGLIAVLHRSLGAAGATAAVVGGALAVAGLLAWLAIARLRKATEVKDHER